MLQDLPMLGFKMEIAVCAWMSLPLQKLMATAIPPALEMQTSAVGDLGPWTSTRTLPTTPPTSLILDASRTPSTILTECFLRVLTTTFRTTLPNGKMKLGSLLDWWKNVSNHHRCVTYCTAGGYDYAGLQYSSQCICSNSGPQGNSDESQCTYGCAGDSSITTCGGLGYINIFHTDAHKSTIDDYGCGRSLEDTHYQRWFEDMGHCNVVALAKGAPPVSKFAPAPGMKISRCSL